MENTSNSKNEHYFISFTKFSDVITGINFIAMLGETNNLNEVRKMSKLTKSLTDQQYFQQARTKLQLRNSNHKKMLFSNLSIKFYTLPGNRAAKKDKGLPDPYLN